MHQENQNHQKQDREGFNSKLNEIASEIRKRDDFVVISHYDGDGITGGAITCKMLERLGKSYKQITVKQLYSETISEIKDSGENFIFVDFGSGQLDILLDNFSSEEGNFFVLDHHIPLPNIQYKYELNPMHYGFSGSREVSGAGLAYFLAKAMDEKNKDLSALAIVGCVADMQDASGQLIGLNAEILNDSIQAGMIRKERDLRLYGRITRPLIQFVMFSTSPILPDLTANEDNCINFLRGLGITLKINEQWVSYSHLTFEEKQALTTALLLHLQKFNLPEWKLQELIGDVYTLINENTDSPLRDAKEFATLLNSAGRHDKPEIGLAVCMGDRNEKYNEALMLLRQHKLALRKGIELMTKQGVDEFESFYFFDAGNEIQDSLIGIVAGMLYGSGVIESNKPIIALARYDEEWVKLSGRATKDLIYKGLNLGVLLKQLCREFGEGCEGGGHCLEKDTIIITENGFEKIDSFNGKKILSKNRETTTFDEFNRKFRKKINRKIRVKTDLFMIECSEDHRFFRYESGDIKEVKAADLNKNDFILGAKKLKIPKKMQKLENTPFVYLNEKGIRLIKQKRIELDFERTGLCKDLQNFSPHNLYDLENMASHRVKENALSEILQRLKINKNEFYSNYIQRTFTSKIKKITPDFARLIGYITGDGFIDGKRLEFKEPDKEIIKNMLKIIKKYFNPTSKIIPQKKYSIVRAYSSDFCRFLTQNFPELKNKAHYVKTPKKLVFSSDRIIAEFIGGLFDAEATVAPHSIKISMASKQILTETQLLLLNFNILSSLRKNVIFDLEINDPTSIKNFSKRIKFTKNSKKDLMLKKLIKGLKKKKRNSNNYLPITMGEFTQKLKDLEIDTKIFGFPINKRGSEKRISKTLFEEELLPNLRKYLKKYPQKNKKFNLELRKIYPENFMWARIKKINRIKSTETMFDLSVPTTENYIANGLIVHNSIAAGAKVSVKKKDAFLNALNEGIKEQLNP